MIKKLGYHLKDYLLDRGYYDGDYEETKNQWYDIGFEDGFEEGTKDARRSKRLLEWRRICALGIRRKRTRTK